MKCHLILGSHLYCVLGLVDYLNDILIRGQWYGHFSPGTKHLTEGLTDHRHVCCFCYEEIHFFSKIFGSCFVFSENTYLFGIKNIICTSSFRLWAVSPFANTAIFIGLPRPFGRIISSSSLFVGWFISRFLRLIARSTLSANFRCGDFSKACLTASSIFSCSNIIPPVVIRLLSPTDDRGVLFLL